MVYDRPYQINEPESLQNIIIKYVCYNIKSRYPKKIISLILYNHTKRFVPYTSECEYRLDYRCKDKPWSVATIYLDPLFKNHKQIIELERDGYKFHKNDKLTISTYNSIKKFNPIFYRDHIPKSMFIKKILQLIDKNLDIFKQWGCDFNCIEQPWKCKNNNPVTKSVCYKLYSQVHIQSKY